MIPTNQQKWYDNKAVLIVLFFILPPLGLYAMVRHKTDLWKKLLYILPAAFFTTIFIVAILAAVFSDPYQSGLNYYHKKQYVTAYNNFLKVAAGDENYKEAAQKITELKPIVDSIKKAEALIKKETSSAQASTTDTAASEKRNDIKTQVKREIVSLNKGVTVGNGGNITSLQMDLVLFGAYWKILQDAAQSEDPEVKRLANEMKSKVVALQVKGFPTLRKKYTAFARELLWEHDIDVYATGNGRTLNLTGGLFATNKNIKDTQELLSENIRLFRFRQVQYRWYKGDDEFTYYNIDAPNDKEAVVFER